MVSTPLSSNVFLSFSPNLIHLFSIQQRQLVQTVAFVFKDLLLSQPNETTWQKLAPPDGGSDQKSPWHTSGYAAQPGITNRLEHTAVLDKHGSMYVWGGRFQTVSQIVGLWRLDVFTPDAKLRYEPAPPDGIEEYEAELEALHMFIATMMFMSLLVSSLFSMMRRNGIDYDDGGPGGAVGSGVRSLTRRGLSRQAIDSIPVKLYAVPAPEVTEDGDAVEDVSLGRENGLVDNEPTLEENLECCAICLTPFEEGVTEVRTLPCGHVFDKECIDAWFQDHTTCPSCRQNVGDSIAQAVSHGEVERRAAHEATTGRWRYHSHWGSNNTGSEEEEEEESSSAIADAIEEQFESDSRWQFMGAFDDRRRHGHWDQSTTSGSGTDSSEGSSQSNDDAGIINVRDQDGDHDVPRFLGIRRFFSRRGHVAVMAVPREDQGGDPDSIELV